jgi:hypothetical protein
MQSPGGRFRLTHLKTTTSHRGGLKTLQHTKCRRRSLEHSPHQDQCPTSRSTWHPQFKQLALVRCTSRNVSGSPRSTPSTLLGFDNGLFGPPEDVPGIRLPVTEGCSVWKSRISQMQDLAAMDRADTASNRSLEAIYFFSDLSTMLQHRNLTSQEMLDHLFGSQYFSRSLAADKLGQQESELLSRVFEYVVFGHDDPVDKPQSLSLLSAITLLQHYQRYSIPLSQEIWSKVLSEAACNIYRHVFRTEKDEYKRAAADFQTTRGLSELLDTWILFCKTHQLKSENARLFEGVGSVGPTGHNQTAVNAPQERFFSISPGWIYGQNLATNQLVYCSALLTSVPLFELVRRIAAIRPNEAPLAEDQEGGVQPLDYSMLGHAPLWFVSQLASAVHGTIPNRMFLRLGLTRMSVRSEEASRLQDHIAELTRCEVDIQDHTKQLGAEPGNPTLRSYDLTTRVGERLSRWIEIARMEPLGHMSTALAHNSFSESVIIRPTQPLLEKMSIRWFQLQNCLPQKIWKPYVFDYSRVGLTGSESSLISSSCSATLPTLQAIILRTLYHQKRVKAFEHAWNNMDMKQSRIPNALWWLRFRLLWRMQKFRLVMENYPAALVDLVLRTPVGEQSTAILRLTNRMLCLVAEYGRPSYSRNFLRQLLERDIKYNSETCRWLLRLYIRNGQPGRAVDLLRGYRACGGSGKHLGKESQMLFDLYIRRLSERSQTPLFIPLSAINEAIDTALGMRDTTILDIRIQRKRLHDLASTPLGKLMSAILPNFRCWKGLVTCLGRILLRRTTNWPKSSSAETILTRQSCWLFCMSTSPALFQ